MKDSQFHWILIMFIHFPIFSPCNRQKWSYIPMIYPNVIPIFIPNFRHPPALPPPMICFSRSVSVLRFGECFPPNHGGRNDGTTLDNGGLLKTQTSRYHQQLYTKYTNDYAGIMRAKESRVETERIKKRSLAIYISNNHQLCRPHQINTSHHRTCQFTSMCRFSHQQLRGSQPARSD